MCFRYYIGKDPAGWLSIDKDTGLIRVKSPMDRESHFVKDGRYTSLIWAVDNGNLSLPLCGFYIYNLFIYFFTHFLTSSCMYFSDQVPATGTGTLIIELEDVNDNAPVIEDRIISVCNKDSSPVVLSVTDKDGPRFGAPFSVDLQGDGKNNWTAKMNDSSKFSFNY